MEITNRKDILILGGTGAMGVPLVNMLSYSDEYNIYVTSRKKHKSKDNITYIEGNAHDIEFVKTILAKRKYFAVIDFMIYTTEEFKKIIGMYLENTRQYFFISSARVYAKSCEPLTEKCPRILDICEETEYLETDEYALKKARQEDILLSFANKNWTIIRPGLIYNNERLQLPLDEKEGWLFRAINGFSIVFPKDIADVYTTMTWGNDVSRAIIKLIGNDRALGEIIHIAGAKAITWGEVLNIYVLALNAAGISTKVHYISNSEYVSKYFGKYYQYKYARSISRTFNNDKLKSIIGDIVFADPKEGLVKCVNGFLEGKREFKKISPKIMGYYDKVTDEHVPLKVFETFKKKLLYLKTRYFL